MVKNIFGGNKSKRQRRGYQKKEEINHVEAGQMFGQVLESRGEHFMILCADNVTRIGWLSNAAKKGIRLSVNSYVVISVRDYETEKKNCDVIGAACPPNDIKNIFRKINPNAGADDNIKFYTQNDKFKEFEDSEATSTQVTVINKNTEQKDDNKNIINTEEWFDEDAKWSDPKIKEEITWDDI
jgi:translation initiation factor IF-1